MKEMNQIQSYFARYATEKARIRNVTVNGKRATVIFKEYEAAAKDKEEFKKCDGSDGHYYYITMYIWNGCKSYYTDKEISTEYTYITDKTEGNKIFSSLKQPKL